MGGAHLAGPSRSGVDLGKVPGVVEARAAIDEARKQFEAADDAWREALITANEFELRGHVAQQLGDMTPDAARARRAVLHNAESTAREERDDRWKAVVKAQDTERAAIARVRVTEAQKGM